MKSKERPSMDEIEIWCGKRIEDMSREELIVALKRAGSMVADTYSPEAIHFRAQGRISAMKDEARKTQIHRSPLAFWKNG